MCTDVQATLAAEAEIQLHPVRVGQRTLLRQLELRHHALAFQGLQAESSSESLNFITGFRVPLVRVEGQN